MHVQSPSTQLKLLSATSWILRGADAATKAEDAQRSLLSCFQLPLASQDRSDQVGADMQSLCALQLEGNAFLDHVCCSGANRQQLADGTGCSC